MTGVSVSTCLYTTYHYIKDSPDFNWRAEMRQDEEATNQFLKVGAACATRCCSEREGQPVVTPTRQEHEGPPLLLGCTTSEGGAPVHRLLQALPRPRVPPSPPLPPLLRSARTTTAATRSSASWACCATAR